MITFLKFAKFISFPFHKTLYWVKVEGKENIPKDKGFILCSNHISYIEPVLIVLYFKKPVHFMGKAEIFGKNKIFDAFLRGVNVFPVERGSGGAEAIEFASKLIADGKAVGIFPEGTRSKDGVPMRAKSGAALLTNMTGADVLPMAVVIKGKMRPFKRIRIIVGELIPNSQLAFEETDRKGLRRASTLIMGRITELWKKGQGLAQETGDRDQETGDL